MKNDNIVLDDSPKREAIRIEDLDGDVVVLEYKDIPTLVEFLASLGFVNKRINF